jgi:hypothetical protein
VGWKITVLAVLALAATFELTRPPVARAGEPATKVGTFDLRKVLSETKPGGAVKEKEKSQPGNSHATGDPLKSKEAQEIRDKIAKIGKELERKGPTKAEQQKLEAEVSGLRKKLVLMRRDAIGRGKARVPEGFEDPDDSQRQIEVMEVVSKYAQEKGFALLSETGYWSQGEQQKAIVFRGKPIDVTDDIIQRVKAKAQTGEQPKK